LVQTKRFREETEKAMKKGNNLGNEISSVSQLKKFGKVVNNQKKKVK